MKRNIKHLLTVTALMLAVMVIGANAQKKAPPYSISKVKITSFDSMTGTFGKEIVEGDETSFFNDLDISLFVVVEVTGEAGSFEGGRLVNVVVTANKKVINRSSAQIGVVNSDGKFYIPVWINRSLCSDVTITASIVGQNKPSRVVRKVPFMCGE